MTSSVPVNRLHRRPESQGGHALTSSSAWKSYGDPQIADAGLLAGVEHVGHLLEFAVAVAAHQHAEVSLGRGRRPAGRSVPAA